NASCSYTNQTINLTNTFNGVGNGSNAAAPNQDQQNCAIDNNDSLRWVLCPILWIAQKATDGLSGYLQTLLYTPTDVIFGSNNQPSQFQDAYNSFRDLGVGLLVVAA